MIFICSQLLTCLRFGVFLLFQLKKLHFEYSKSGCKHCWDGLPSWQVPSIYPCISHMKPPFLIPLPEAVISQRKNCANFQVILAEGPRGCDMFSAAFNAAYVAGTNGWGNLDVIKSPSMSIWLCKPFPNGRLLNRVYRSTTLHATV